MKLLTIALAVTALVVVAPAQGQKNNKNLTLEASANPALYGTTVSLTGDVKGAKAGVPVALQRRGSQTAEFKPAGEALTDANGQFLFEVEPRRNKYFRVVSGDRISDELLVAVAPKVSLAATKIGDVTRIRGRVRPRHAGRRVHFQRRQGETWTTVTRAKLRRVKGKRFSRYRKRLPALSAGTYRTILPGHDDHAQGTSVELTVG